MKAHLELECTCQTCKLSFIIYDLESQFKEVDSGFHISGLKCPNCQDTPLDFDIDKRKIRRYIKGDI